MHTSETLLAGLDPIDANKKLQSDVDLSLASSSAIANDRVKFATYRARPVHAVSSSSNWPFMYAMNAHLKGWLYRYPNTYRIVRRTDINRRLKRQPHSVAIDFSEFDRTMEAVLIEMFLQAGEAVAPDYFIAGLRRSFFCGLFSPSINLDGSDAAWLGRPDAISEHYLGLPSGHCMNVPLGRLKGAFSMIVMMTQGGFFHLSDWRKYLGGDLDVGSAANATDDCLFFFKRSADAVRFREMVEKGSFSRVGNIGLEEATMYLGMCITKPRSSTEAPYAVRRPSGLIRALVPERSNDMRVKPNSPLGWLSRFDEYGLNSAESSSASQTVLDHINAAL